MAAFPPEDRSDFVPFGPGESERPFLRNVNLFGYDSFRVLQSGERIGLRDSTGITPELIRGARVVIEGDSKGYVPSGHRPGDSVRITGFAEPFEGNRSDDIIQVDGGGISGWIKPSNIKREA